MNNEENKVQEKMNASKTKGIKIKTDKDWQSYEIKAIILTVFYN